MSPFVVQEVVSSFQAYKYGAMKIQHVTLNQDCCCPPGLQRLQAL